MTQFVRSSIHKNILTLCTYYFRFSINVILFHFLPVPCPTGTYLSNNNSCVPCSLGTYQDQTAADTCEPCPNNTYTDKEGAVSIKQCIGML